MRKWEKQSNRMNEYLLKQYIKKMNELRQHQDNINHSQDKKIIEEKKPLKFILQLVIGLLLCFILFAILNDLFLKNFWKIKYIKITSEISGVEGNIRTFIKKNNQLSYWQLNKERIIDLEKGLKENIKINNIKISKIFPDKIQVEVKDQEILAIVKYKNKTWLMDQTGSMVEKKREVQSRYPLVIIKSQNLLRFNNDNKLMVFHTGFWESLYNLKKSEQSIKYYNSLKNIIVYVEYNYIDRIIIQLHNIPVSIVYEPYFDIEKMKNLEIALKVLEKQGELAYIKQLDFRTEEIVYKLYR